MTDDVSTPRTLWVTFDDDRWNPTEEALEELVRAIDGSTPDDVECIVVPDTIEYISKDDARGMLSRLISRALSE